MSLMMKTNRSFDMRAPLFPCLCLSLIAHAAAHADSPVGVARTNRNTLNDLVREVPAISPSWEKQLRRLSAVQEQLYLHERRMRGEGLPAEMSSLFSEHYTAILAALVEDRITEDYGRELLSIHRQLLERTRHWLEKRVREPGYPQELADNLAYFRDELDRDALLPAEVPEILRTPVVNGYQAWVGELLAWGEESGGLAPGIRSRIRVKLEELERFEGYYKADGVLRPYEIELLHARFLKVSRETIEAIAR